MKKKGQRTRQRILAEAGALFAQQGYRATSLRQIASGAGIREPGLYNHFPNKQAIYEAVLQQFLNPLAQSLSQHIEGASGLRDYTDLPALMTDLMLEHQHMAALLHQALRDDSKSAGNQLVMQWLNRLFNRGMQNMEALGVTDARTGAENHLANQAINVIALLNVTTGYFLAERSFTTLTGGNLLDGDNINRQKRLLHRVMRAMLIS